MNIVSNPTENFTGLLIFSVSDVDYCLNNSVITSVIKPHHIFKLKTSHTSKYFLLKIGNKSIPLIDLKKIFQSKDQKLNSSTRVIIIEHQEEQFGLLVEKVKEIIALDPDYLNTSGQFSETGNSIYIEGIFELENKKLLLPNIERIIKDIGYF